MPEKDAIKRGGMADGEWRISLSGTAILPSSWPQFSYSSTQVVGDGSMVPATDDEVMEVEDLLEDDKSEIHSVADTGQNVGCASNDEFPSTKTQFDGSEGQCENPEVDTEKSNTQLDTTVELEKLNAGTEETVPLFATNSNDGHIDQPGSGGECSNPLDGPIENESSVSALCTNSKPDFSKLEGEICLDNLSVRELHETFKATFGRETSVKDKQFTPLGCNNLMENPEDVSDDRLRNPGAEYDCSVGDLQTEQKAAKRVRKPTKRYIEELSEVESREYSGKLVSSVKNSGDGQSSPVSRVRPVRDTWLDGRPVVTRQDSLGGSGVQVPYVCRVRRSRPRENFMALMELQPSSMGMATKLVKKALGVRGARPDNKIGNKVFKARSASGWIQKPPVAEPEKVEHYQEIKASELEKDADLKHLDSSGDYSDEYTGSMPAAKGGMRRKHHRPWTLSEVVKLVEGVARYGVGRWSEIKRLAFASYSYRTSVDLKDKWRNLLRASFANSPAEKGMQMQSSRKHASVPIPAPILLRVRELAEIQAQVAPNLSSSKLAACGGRNVHETRSEYHLGQLKAKIAKLRTQLLEPPKGSSGAGEGFEVTKYGHGRVALIGFPSVGKSTLLTLLTGTHSEAASYEFTTLTCIPGIIHYNDTKIQLLDLPGIIEGASEGKGRGRQVIAVSKSSDIVLMVLDASKSEGHRQILTKELEAVGLRLNKRPPQRYISKRRKLEVSLFNSTIPLTHVDEKLCYQILHEYKIHNAEPLICLYSSPNPKPNSHHFQPPAQPWTATCAATRQPPTPCAALRNQTASNPASCAASVQPLQPPPASKQPPPQPPNSLCAAPACAATIQPLRSLCAHADSSLCAAPVQPSQRYQQHLLLPVQPSLALTAHRQPIPSSPVPPSPPFSRALLYLGGKRKTRWILGKEPKPAESDPKFDEWVSDNCIILGWMFNSMEDRVYHMFMYHDTVHGLWSALTQMYAHARNESRIFELYRETRWEELAQYEPLSDFPSDGAVESKRLDRRHTYQFLMGLKSEFETLRTQILNTSPLPSLYEAFAIVDGDERSRRLLPSLSLPESSPIVPDQRAFAAASGTHLYCQHCRKPGHLIDRCWVLHPELKQQFSRPHGGGRGGGRSGGRGRGTPRTGAVAEVESIPANLPDFKTTSASDCSVAVTLGISYCLPVLWPHKPL
ncbi:P-loop containing nucleoside triphosphate hydrolases superfamily protein [Actinidia rufa]|uniref:P-loop containing nucleoside triphosphate hydrolases superfamily protein n=1 Tax=Actinidia rufa TaxID=165716 RepID=A0A7J0GLV8_9ERIC|nr:P-loop containing nucleoside triphosphate hydrolases superfamily protein [Actinidia rufa]